jgi:tetratricopeptide (TPR) repeat protein
VLTAVRTGGTPPDAADIDALNATVHSANRERSADDVKEDARASYAELARAIDDCSDEDLLKPRPGRETLAWEVVPPNGHIHLGEHLGFWYQAQGDERAAEQAQKWMLEVHEAAFTDPRSRAFGEYNLACYYARQGRSADAIPHIRQSFELHPALKEWARTDKDLDRIRQEPELLAILG